jgi:hypothetical protein
VSQVEVLLPLPVTAQGWGQERFRHRLLHGLQQQQAQHQTWHIASLQ